MMEKKYFLGLDLHGTLLEPGEILRPELIPALIEGLQKIADRAVLFLCTGNDLEFVDRKIPGDLRDCFNGYVLETGCSWSPDRFQEKVLTTPEEQTLIKDLELELNEQRFTEVNYFAHRLTTISMFCNRPREFFPEVEAAVAALGVRERVLVTYSSVAVDILPRGYNKFTGLKKVAEGRKTIGIADSMNDAALLLEADFALAPQNLASELKPLLASSGRPVIPLIQATDLASRAVPISAQRETEGVLEILAFLNGNL
jgi:hydroxymethylpyrimidine pyrophosphatase-like HAD family hydrolase